MVEPAEFWTFAIANLVTFVLGSLLTLLSYYAYRQNRHRPSFRNATLGFGLLTLGMLVEPVYQLWLKGDYNLTGRELLALQTIEGVFLGLGFLMLFYSIYRHNIGQGDTRRTREEFEWSNDRSRW
ncbi:DUF7521 family protein [Haloferax sulfurifontis]